MKTAAFLLACAIASPVAAQGTLLAVNWAGDATLIDSTTGTETPLGPSGAAGLNSLAVDPTTGNFYSVGSYPFQVYTISPVTGAATATGFVLVSLDVRALAIDWMGTCWAIVNGLPDNTAPDLLYTIDLSTGAATLIGPTGSASIQALAIDSSGAMFAWAVTPPALWTVDPATAATALVGGVSTSVLIQALAFSPSGTLYGAGLTSLYTLDPATAAPTIVGSGYSDLRGIEFAAFGTVSFLPSTAQVAPGGGLAVYYSAPLHPNELFVPVVSCTPGTTSIPGLSTPLPLAWDPCTDLYFTTPSALAAMPLSGITGSYFGYLDASGIAVGLVLPPLGVIPPGLNLAVRVTYVTWSPLSGFHVHGAGTFTLI